MQEGATCVSPELVLVCPELRAAMLADLPDVDPDAWLDRLRNRPVTTPEFQLMAFLADAPLPDEATPLPLAILAYTAASVTRFSIEAAVFLGLVVGLLSVVTVVHS